MSDSTNKKTRQELESEIGEIEKKFAELKQLLNELIDGLPDDHYLVKIAGDFMQKHAPTEGDNQPPPNRPTTTGDG